jgi:hypothetical protein
MGFTTSERSGNQPIHVMLIHEFGHAFAWRKGIHTEVESGDIFASEGFDTNQIDWQGSPQIRLQGDNSFEELFADLFLGWVLEVDSTGFARNTDEWEFMNNIAKR